MVRYLQKASVILPVAITLPAWTGQRQVPYPQAGSDHAGLLFAWPFPDAVKIPQERQAQMEQADHYRGANRHIEERIVARDVERQHRYGF